MQRLPGSHFIGGNNCPQGRRFMASPVFWWKLAQLVSNLNAWDIIKLTLKPMKCHLRHKSCARPEIHSFANTHEILMEEIHHAHTNENCKVSLIKQELSSLSFYKLVLDCFLCLYPSPTLPHTYLGPGRMESKGSLHWNRSIDYAWCLFWHKCVKNNPSNHRCQNANKANMLYLVDCWFTSSTSVKQSLPVRKTPHQNLCYPFLFPSW